MRDLINILESVGLANRRPGDRWTNPQGDELIFVDLTFHPAVAGFQSPDLLTKAVNDVSQANGFDPQNIIWTNAQGNNQAFALAHFVDAANQDYYFGRYFRQISPNRTENRFPNDLPGGYRLQTKTAVKERAGYKPTDILTTLDGLTPDDILNQVEAKFGASSAEATAMQLFMSADKFPLTIPAKGINFTAFTNYFCEMLQPMALVMNKPLRGNAAAAESKFLSEGGYSDCLISFGISQTAGLVDSVLTNSSGQTIGVSSKAKGAAKASAKNLQDKITEMNSDPNGRKILKKYQKETNIIQAISQGGYVDGPLDLAVDFGIIKPQDKQQVKALKGKGQEWNIDTLPGNLQKLYQDRSSADPQRIVPFYHMLAAIAHKVADHVNKNTQFSKAASEILNYGAFVQAYTSARPSGDNIVLDTFEVRYPSTAVTNVMLRADKTYYSTGNKGNLTFQILLNDATLDDVEVDSSAVDTKPDVDLDAIDRAPRLVGPGARAARTQAEPKLTPAVLGRERR